MILFVDKVKAMNTAFLFICLTCFYATDFGHTFDEVPSFFSKNLYLKNISLENLDQEIISASSLHNDQFVDVGGESKYFIVDLGKINKDVPLARRYNWNVNCTGNETTSEGCKNWIRTLSYDEKTQIFLVCGTYGGTPRCRYFNYGELNVNKINEVDASQVCPYNKGNTGLIETFKGNVLAVTLHTPQDKIGGEGRLAVFKQLDFDFIEKLRTPNSRSPKSFNYPNFVKMMEVGDWILIFFNEITFQDEVPSLVSRVAKVCKQEIVDYNAISKRSYFSSFQKMDITCSLRTNSDSITPPFLFRRLRDVKVVRKQDGSIVFYVVFTTDEVDVHKSAVCKYGYDALEKIFYKGRFQKRAASTCNVISIPEKRVPAGARTWICTETSNFTNDESMSRFIKNNPKMYDSVDRSPLFRLTRTKFQVIREAVYERESDGTTQLYLGTDDGRILNVVEWQNGSSWFLEETSIDHSRHGRIVSLDVKEVASTNATLVVVTQRSILQIPLNYFGKSSVVAKILYRKISKNNTELVWINKKFENSTNFGLSLQSSKNILDSTSVLVASTSRLHTASYSMIESGATSTIRNYDIVSPTSNLSSTTIAKASRTTTPTLLHAPEFICNYSCANSLENIQPSTEFLDSTTVSTTGASRLQSSSCVHTASYSMIESGATSAIRNYDIVSPTSNLSSTMTAKASTTTTPTLLHAPEFIRNYSFANSLEKIQPSTEFHDSTTVSTTSASRLQSSSCVHTASSSIFEGFNTLSPHNSSSMTVRAGTIATPTMRYTTQRVPILPAPISNLTNRKTIVTTYPSQRSTTYPFLHLTSYASKSDFNFSTDSKNDSDLTFRTEGLTMTSYKNVKTFTNVTSANDETSADRLVPCSKKTRFSEDMSETFSFHVIWFSTYVGGVFTPLVIIGIVESINNCIQHISE